MNNIITIYTQEESERFHNSNNYFSTFALYNGAINPDDDPADFITPIKAVRLA